MEKELERQFLEAYEQYADALFRHCCFRISDREIAKDLVQEAYMKTWVYVVEEKEIQNIKALLYRILNNSIIDYFRKKKAVSLDTMMEDTGFDPAEKEIGDPETRLLGKEVMKLLSKLDNQYREIITLRFVDGLTPKEIAEVLHTSPNVVSVRLHRAIEKLRSQAPELFSDISFEE